MDARQVDVLLHRDVGAGERIVGRLPVAASQWKMWLSFLSFLSVRARRARFERLERIDDDRQRLVVDVDGVDAVGGGAPTRRDTPATSCAWYITFSVGSTICVSDISVGIQCRLYCASVSPVITASTPGTFSARSVLIDLMRVGERAADDVQVEHAGQLDVVHVAALPADEARIFLALDRMAHSSDVRCRSRRHRFLP